MRDGTFFAEFMVGASLSPSLAQDKLHEEAQAGNEEVNPRFNGGGDAWHGVGGCVRSKTGTAQATSERTRESNHKR